jgi:hypothetical protein
MGINELNYLPTIVGNDPKRGKTISDLFPQWYDEGNQHTAGIMIIIKR